MNRGDIETMIRQLNGMIAALAHAVLRTARECEACELLRSARMKLVEDINQRQEEGLYGNTASD